MSDYIIAQERISWLASLREFHNLEREDEQQDEAVQDLDQRYSDHQQHGEDLLKNLADAVKAQAPIDQKHEELVYKVDKAKTAMEKERALRKETEKQLCQEMQLKDNQIGMEREQLEQRYRNEIEKKEKNWERERVKMKADRESFNERLLVAEGEINEMMKCQDAQTHMKKLHYDQMALLKKQFKIDEDKWKVSNVKIQCKQSEVKMEIRRKVNLWAGERRDKKDSFRSEKAQKEISWKKTRSAMVKTNRVLALKSCFTEHWIKDLEEQIRTVGSEIQEMKVSLSQTIQELEEKCLQELLDQHVDTEPMKELFRTTLNLSNTLPSAKRKHCVWKLHRHFHRKLFFPHTRESTCARSCTGVHNVGCL